MGNVKDLTNVLKRRTRIEAEEKEIGVTGGFFFIVRKLNYKQLGK